VYAWLSLDRDAHAARTAIGPALASSLCGAGAGIHLRGLPFAEELVARLAAG